MKKSILFLILALILITQVSCGEESIFNSKFFFPLKISVLAILIFFLFWWRRKSNKVSLEERFWNKLLNDFIIKFLWEDIIIKYLYKGVIGGIFNGIVSSIPDSVSKTMNVILPTVALAFTGFYFEESIVNTAVEYKEDYMTKILESSLDIKIIRPLTKIPFWSKVLYSSLLTDFEDKRDRKKSSIPESRIDNEYKHLEKSFNEWQDNFDENLDFIRDSISKDNLKKRMCLGKKEKISESECEFRKINKKLLEDQGFFKKLKACYNRYNKNKDDSCFKTTEYTLSMFDNQIQGFDENVIKFYRKFTEERKD